MSLRDEIVGALKGVSGTPRWIAGQINAPVRAVREELSALALQGIAKARTHKSGEVLYRLKDRHDDAWDALRLPAIHPN
ncbi:MAG: hypothetical protein K0S14_1417 [Thermomicrobiales bacterium]|jgi:hypothetical protein|nr:hypothetical protein [Thermomicrobiales bacterium]